MRPVVKQRPKIGLALGNNVAEVQKHGLSLELALRGSSRFFGAHLVSQSLQAEHDIPAQFDAMDGKPTWVKAVACKPMAGKPAGAASAVMTLDGRCLRAGEFCMADALRFWQSQGDVRLIVGFYEQKGARKEFFDLREFHLNDASFQTLRGGMPASEIEDIRETMRAFGAGLKEAEKARQCAKEDVAKAKAAYPATITQLRPKIDSKTQRRLQCAVSLEGMTQASASWRSIPLAEMAHHGFDAWPWSVQSAPRTLKSKKQKALDAAALALAAEGVSTPVPMAFALSELAEANSRFAQRPAGCADAACAAWH